MCIIPHAISVKSFFARSLLIFHSTTTDLTNIKYISIYTYDIFLKNEIYLKFIFPSTETTVRFLPQTAKIRGVNNQGGFSLSDL